MITLSREPGSTAEFATSWAHSQDLSIVVEPQTQPPLAVNTQFSGNASVYVHVVSGGTHNTTYTVHVSGADEPEQTQQVYKEAEQ